MINSNDMYECEWCYADLGSSKKAYDEHVAECSAAIAAYNETKQFTDKFIGTFPDEKENSTNRK